MTKYEIGDKFIVEITDIDEQGMGVAYTLNDYFICNEKTLDSFELQEIVPLSKELDVQAEVKKPHTSEELKNKIFEMSELLANAIKTYREVTTTVDMATDTIDRALRDSSL